MNTLPTAAPPRLTALAAAWIALASAPRPAEAQLGPVQRVKLENGLTLLMLEDHRMPRVGMALVYPVGSRDDPPGFQDLAHVVEHALGDFRGHSPGGGMHRLERIGASANAMTTPDETVFYCDLPSPALETAFWVESDRMAYLLTEVDERDLARIRTIAGHEMRENHGQLDWMEREVAHALYPAPHPYRELLLRSDELANIDVNAVRWFFQRHYGPSTAVLAVVGDIDPAATERMARKYFGPIKDSSALVRQRPAAPPAAVSAREDVLPPPIGANWRYEQLHVAWPTPAQYADGDAALDVAATLLSERLSASIVRDGSVFRAGVGQVSRALGSTFSIALDLVPGHSAEDMLAVIERELAALSRESAAFERARASWVVKLLGRLDQFAGVASMIGRAELRGLRLSPRDDIERYRSLRAEDVARAVQRYLSPATRVVVRTEFSRRAAPPRELAR